MATEIATWFVADEPGQGTYFPQIASLSDTRQAQSIYWRCAACFYASSLAVNPEATHVFYTNTQLPTIDGIDFSILFRKWGVEVHFLPITWRLPHGQVASWGNQFYIFDVIRAFAARGTCDRLILLDCDCLWRRPVTAMEQAIERDGALTYDVGEDDHGPGEMINGLTRAGMARFLAAQTGIMHQEIPYLGGELFAANLLTSGTLLARCDAMWPSICASVPDAPREEAHLLSVVYAAEGIAVGTANRFVRRMWTTFRYNDLRPSDADLTIWHLPAEKKTGFAALFRRITANADWHPSSDADEMGLTAANYARTMGFPRRSLKKTGWDLGLKISERIRDKLSFR